MTMKSENEIRLPFNWFTRPTRATVHWTIIFCVVLPRLWISEIRNNALTIAAFIVWSLYDLFLDLKLTIKFWFTILFSVMRQRRATKISKLKKIKIPRFCFKLFGFEIFSRSFNSILFFWFSFAIPSMSDNQLLSTLLLLQFQKCLHKKHFRTLKFLFEIKLLLIREVL